MTAIIFLLLVLPANGQQQTRPPRQQAPMLFDERHLGKDGMDAFLHPDSVTFLRVYPLQSPSEGSLHVGKWDLFAAGPEREVGTSASSSLAMVLQSPHAEILSLCFLHPDHLLRFKKGAIVVSVVTCYTCHLLDVSLNDMAIGGTDMPGDQALLDLPGLVTTEEDCRAVWDEHFGPGTYANLVNANSATYQRVQVSGQSSSNPVLKLIGEPQPMPDADFLKLRTLLLLGPILQGKVFNQFGMKGPEIGSDVLVTMKSSAPAQFLFRKRAFDLHLKLSEGSGNSFVGELQVWEAFSNELGRMAGG